MVADPEAVSTRGHRQGGGSQGEDGSGPGDGSVHAGVPQALIVHNPDGRVAEDLASTHRQ